MAEQPIFSPSSDASLWVDTAKAPWMDVARRQIGTKEFRTSPSFLRLLYVSAVQMEVPGLLTPLKKEAGDILKNAVVSELGHQKGSATTAAKGTQVSKYLATVKTDPQITGKSYPLGEVGFHDPETLAKKGQTVEWESTPWCAAFVNWCLLEAQQPYLGYATAESWLKFGTPLSAPVPGCVTVVPSGAGFHVAFLVEKTAKGVRLLGGNQGPKAKGEPDEVNEKTFSIEPVGYRWPTNFNHTLTLPSRTGIA